MKIAILAWGSLVWDSKDLPKIEEGWVLGGPTLPIEFSRISKSRGGSLTLVIDPENGVETATQYAISSRSVLEDAVCDLRCREGTVVRNIGFIELENGREQSRFPQDVTGRVREWAVENGFDAVVWTDLPSNFEQEANKEFCAENAVDYLRSLGDQEACKAREYISKAPIYVQTSVREAVVSTDWYKHQDSHE